MSRALQQHVAPGAAERGARRVRGDGPLILAQIRHGQGVPEIVGQVLAGWRAATPPGRRP